MKLKVAWTKAGVHTLSMPPIVELAFQYAAALMISNHLMAAWLHSNFPQHLWNSLHPGAEKVSTKDDLMLAADSRYGGWGDLWTCPMCSGTWIGAASGFLVFISTEAPWWFVPFCALTNAGILTLRPSFN